MSTAPGIARARTATADDIPQIVAAHVRGFAGFFLTFLGNDFLALLYRSLLADRDGIVFVWEEAGRVAGFVAGTTDQVGFYRRMLTRRLFAFGWIVAGVLLRRPGITPRVLLALGRPAQARRESARASLMSIAVRPEDEGRGIGQALVRAFAAELTGRGVRAYCLTTDRDHNERAHRFYQQLGFRRVNEHATREGRVKSEYLMKLEG